MSNPALCSEIPKVLITMSYGGSDYYLKANGNRIELELASNIATIDECYWTIKCVSPTNGAYSVTSSNPTSSNIVKSCSRIDITCPTQLRQLRVEQAYAKTDMTSGSCDICNVTLNLKDIVFHCSLNKYHRRGYDLCPNCASNLNSHNRKKKQLENNNKNRNNIKIPKKINKFSSKKHQQKLLKTNENSN